VNLNLFQIGSLLILCSIIVRIGMIILPATRFVTLFDGAKSTRQGLALIRRIEIPGMNQFLKQEMILGLSPYLSIGLAMYVFDLSSLGLSGLSTTVSLITLIGLLVWLLLDWSRSYIVYQQIDALYTETKQLKSISGNVLDGLRYVVYLRPSLGKTALLLGKRAAVGSVQNKIKEKEASSGKKSLAGVAFMAIESLISFPERVVGRITDWAKDSVDERLKGMFDYYATRSRFEFLGLFAWSLFPAIWLAIIAGSQ